MDNMMIQMKGALAEKRALLWVGSMLRKQYIAMPTIKWGKMDKMGIDILIRDINNKGKIIATLQVKSSDVGADKYVGAAQYIIVAPEGSDDAIAMPNPYFVGDGEYKFKHQVGA